MKTHRDRGRRKKHHRPPSQGALKDRRYASFSAWLTKTYPLKSEGLGGPATSISVTRFLQDAAEFDLSSAEKLRELAIHWETGCVVLEQPTGWHVLRQIYDEAIRIEPNWSALYHSKSLGAGACAGSATDTSIKEAILVDAERACNEGLAVNPHDGLLHHSLGMTLYERDGGTAEALASFDAAITCDSGQVWWSHLYRAHCLHDLHRWSEAAHEYRRVDRSRFFGPTAWRGRLAREQLAHCLYFAGEVVESRALFTAAVETYEAHPESLDVTRYVEAASGFFGQELGSRIAALLKAQEFLNADAQVAEDS